MSMSGSFLPSLGRQQPQFTRVEGADIVMKSSEPNTPGNSTLRDLSRLISSWRDPDYCRIANNPPTEAISKDLAKLIRVPNGIAAEPARWQHSRRVQMAVEHGPK